MNSARRNGNDEGSGEVTSPRAFDRGTKRVQKREPCWEAQGNRLCTLKSEKAPRAFLRATSEIFANFLTFSPSGESSVTCAEVQFAEELP